MTSPESKDQRMQILTNKAAQEREEHIRRSVQEAQGTKKSQPIPIPTSNVSVEEGEPLNPSVVQEADPGEPTIEEMGIVLQVIEDEEKEFHKDGYLTFNPLALPSPRIPEYMSRFISPPRRPRTTVRKPPLPRPHGALTSPGPEPRHLSPSRPRCCSPLR